MQPRDSVGEAKNVREIITLFSLTSFHYPGSIPREEVPSQVSDPLISKRFTDGLSRLDTSLFACAIPRRDISGCARAKVSSR